MQRRKELFALDSRLRGNDGMLRGNDGMFRENDGETLTQKINKIQNSMNCPKCFCEIPEDDRHDAAGWAACRNCNVFFPLDGSEVPELTPRSDSKKERKITVEETDANTFVFHDPPIRGFTGWLFAVGLIFLGGMFGMCFFHVVFPAPDFRRSAAVIFSCFWVPWLLLDFYFVEIFLLRHRVFRFDREKLCVENKTLFGIHWTKIIPRWRIWGVSEDWAATQGGTIRESRICYDKTYIAILCRSFEEQQWISRLINDYLSATASQRYCCPKCNRGLLVDPMRMDFVDDNYGPKRKCLWCGAEYTLHDAAETGQHDLDAAEKNGGVIRPLFSRIGVKEDDSILHVHLTPWRIQKSEEWFGISLLALGMFVGILCFVGAFFVDSVPGILIMLFYGTIFSFCFGGLFVGTLDDFFKEYLLEIGPDSLRYQIRSPLRTIFKTKKSNRNLELTPETLLTVYPKGRSSFTGKYPVTFEVNGEQFLLPCGGMEERLWLNGVIDRFLRRRIGNTDLLTPLECPRCQTDVEPDWHHNDRLGGAALKCPNCEEVIIKNFWKPPFMKPSESVVEIYRNENSFELKIPSKYEQLTPWEKRGSLLGFTFFALLYIGMHAWIGLRIITGVWPLVQANPWGVQGLIWPIGPALFCGVMYFSVSVFVAYILASHFLTHWTLKINRNEIETCYGIGPFEKRYVFPRTGVRVFCSAESEADDPFRRVLRTKYFHSWYWCDRNPAWSSGCIVITTPHPFAIPYRKTDEEQQWLFAVLKNELE